ncbi:superkiller complex protein 3-like [Sycon ciliatum]|uniref:superkiller complex protein 3-like n=1 Tax=Sycon ciliatum TaxID=27933 RepID=UPI0031F7188F
MASKEVKAALKAAREALDKKEYQDVLKHCKVVLRADKNNYMALIFIGVATSELQQLDQAYAAFTKATNSNPELPLAWQGLADFCVKQKDPKYYKDLTLCYERLARINESKDPGKFCDFSVKHGDAWLQREQPLQALAAWQAALERMADLPAEVVDAKRPVLCQKVSSVITSQLSVEYEYIDQLRSARLGDANAAKSFILYLFRVLQISDDDEINEHRVVIEQSIVTECQEMRQVHHDDTFCRELLCLLQLVQVYVYEQPMAEECSAIRDELAALAEDSAVLQFVIAHNCVMQNQLQEAREAMERGLLLRSSCPLAWLMSGSLLLRLHAYNDACHSARQGLCNLDTPQTREYLLSPSRMKIALQFCNVKGLLSEDEEKYEEAISICMELCKQGCTGADVELLLAQAYMLNGDVTQAADISDTLLRQDRSNHRALCIQACTEAAQEHLRSAEESISEAIDLCPTISEYHLQLGRILWQCHEIEKKSLASAHFMQAAKLDPQDSRPFYEIGVFFADLEKNTSKAQRCFQKAVDLNSGNLKAVIRLGECLQQQGNLSEAMELYQKLTISMPSSQAHVAWSHLGALQLDTGHSQDAIASLQTALRSQPREGSTWEALGTAYLNRGSYSSALKAFLRSVQLSSSVYGLCKIADIKSRLGLNSEAIVDYRRLLEMNDTYLPGLKGLADSFLCLAKDCMAKNFDKTAVDCVSEVLAAIARAAAINPRLMCLWKLMGDACMLLVPLPTDVLQGLCIPSMFSQLQHPSSRMDLLLLASRAYAQCQQVCPDSEYMHWVWHDIAVNCYEQMKDEARDQNREKLAQQSLEAIQTAIRLRPDDCSHWRTLGVLCTHQAINRLALAQHALIKALQLQPDDAMTWSSLGSLYISQNNIELAHKAFAKAQAVDPECISGWLGQAMVAELMQHDETQDLYHHASDLGYHEQAALGLGHWVCSNLLTSNAADSHNREGADSTDGEETEQQQQQQQQQRVPIATQDLVLDLMEKVSRRHPDSNAALSMLGLMLERRKLFSLAEQAHGMVCANLADSTLSDQLDTDTAIANHARALCLCGRYAESMAKFSNVANPRQEDFCWWALAAFHDRTALQHGLCIQLFEKALQLATHPRDMSAILTAAAMAAYQGGDLEMCRKYLMSSSQVQPESAVCQQGLCTLTGLAVLLKDMTLATAALVELRKANMTDVTMIATRAYIESVYVMILGEADSGCRKWMKEIHRSPSDGELWSGLGRYMMQSRTSISKCHHITATAARIKPSLASSTQLISSLSQLSLGVDSRAALRTAQKAVFSCPTSCYAWAALAACLGARAGASVDGDNQQQQQQPQQQQQTAVAAAAAASSGDPYWDDSEGGGGAAAAENVKVDTGNVPHNAEGKLADRTPLIAMCYVKVKAIVQQVQQQDKQHADIGSCMNVEHTQLRSAQELAAWMLVYYHFVQMRASGANMQAEEATFLSTLPLAERVELRLRLISLLSGASQLMASGPLNAAQTAAVRQVVVANADSHMAWQCLAFCYNLAGSPIAAEVCLRQAIVAAAQSGTSSAVIMLRLVLLGLQQCTMGSDSERWMALAQEALREAQRSPQQSIAPHLLHSMVIFHYGNAKFAGRLLNGLLTRSEGTGVYHLVQYYALRAQLKLKNYDTAKALLKDMERAGSPFHMTAFQMFQSLS